MLKESLKNISHKKIAQKIFTKYSNIKALLDLSCTNDDQAIGQSVQNLQNLKQILSKLGPV